MASTIRNCQVVWGVSSFPVAIQKAAEKKDVAFEYAVEVDGQFLPRRQQYVAEGTDKLATDENTKRGVWQGEDFQVIDDATITAIMADAQIENIEIEEFVPLSKIKPDRAQANYILAPQKGLVGAKPLRLLRDAMKGEKVAGLVKFCLKGTGGRQYLGAIYESDGAVRLTVLSFASDMRVSDDVREALDKMDVGRDLVRTARQLVAAMSTSGPSLLDTAEDSAVAQREALLTEALDGKGRATPPPRKQAGEQMDDLMESMRASIAAEAKKRKVKA